MPNQKSDKQGRLCDCCGKPIPKARLLVLPATTTCVQCARGLELEKESDPETPIEIPAGYDPGDLLDSYRDGSDH